MITNGFLTDYNVPFLELQGKTFAKIIREGEKIIFYEFNTNKYTLYHDNQCCEQVYIEDIDGLLRDLELHPILRAEEVSQELPNKGYDEITRWTFYKLATNKASVTIRFYGSSNGCYSVDAQLDHTYWYYKNTEEEN